MRSNGLLKWLMIPVAILVLFVGIRLFSGGGSTAPPAADNGAQLTPDEMKALGIEGDTPRDTVATLVAQVKQLRTELQTALSDNKSQREENQRLRQRENSIDQRINSALESERSQPAPRPRAGGQRAPANRRAARRPAAASGQHRRAAAAMRPARGPGAAGRRRGRHGGRRAVGRAGRRKARRGAQRGRGASGARGGMNFPTSFGPAQSTLETTAETVANAAPAPPGSRVPSRSIPCRPTPRSWVRSP